MLLLMRVNLLQGTCTPLTHAHAGRTPFHRVDLLRPEASVGPSCRTLGGQEMCAPLSSLSRFVRHTIERRVDCRLNWNEKHNNEPTGHSQHCGQPRSFASQRRTTICL